MNTDLPALTGSLYEQLPQDPPSQGDSSQGDLSQGEPLRRGREDVPVEDGPVRDGSDGDGGSNVGGGPSMVFSILKILLLLAALVAALMFVMGFPFCSDDRQAEEPDDKPATKITLTDLTGNRNDYVGVISDGEPLDDGPADKEPLTEEEIRRRASGHNIYSLMLEHMNENAAPQPESESELGSEQAPAEETTSEGFQDAREEQPKEGVVVNG